MILRWSNEHYEAKTFQTHFTSHEVQDPGNIVDQVLFNADDYGGPHCS
jgi:hypothetical protein